MGAISIICEGQKPIAFTYYALAMQMVKGLCELSYPPQHYLLREVLAPPFSDLYLLLHVTIVGVLLEDANS